MFVLFANLVGLLPPIGVHPFTVTSHIIVTFALALFIFLMVLAVGFGGMAYTSSRCSRRKCRGRC